MLSWDDIRVFLALMRAGTTGRAAVELGCSQPTVVRRIAALEDAAGLTLFKRSLHGLIPTEAATKLVPFAERLESAACELETEAASLCGETSSTIRLTLLDHFENLIVPILRDYRTCWPNVQVELLASDQIFDIARGEADIAIRGRAQSDNDAVICRRLPDCAWTVYAPAEMPTSDRPATWQDVAARLIAIPDGILARLPVYQGLAALAEDGGGGIRCSNYNALRSAIAAGSAFAALPVTVGQFDPALVACFPPPTEFDVNVYLLGRRAALRRPHVRALFDNIYDHLTGNPILLNGRG